jgi:hypothetical protein
MTSSRLGLAHGLLACALSLSLAGCLSHERAELLDAGGDGSVSSCATARSGDPCTEEGLSCPIGICAELVCSRGRFVALVAGDTCDAGMPPPDVGIVEDSGSWCECPAPPPGCTYDGSPCVCSHLSCPVEHCGRELCGPGTTCCNASCGTCVGPGEDCVAVECAPDCSPQDARSGGRCAASAGWAWDGEACREIACRCEGSDCDAVYPTLEACNAYFSACPAVDCTSDDAVGTGGCDAVLGYAFTVRGCFAISGCSCVGADSSAVVGRTEPECSDVHASCPILFD